MVKNGVCVCVHTDMFSAGLTAELDVEAACLVVLEVDVGLLCVLVQGDLERELGVAVDLAGNVTLALVDLVPAGEVGTQPRGVVIDEGDDRVVGDAVGGGGLLGERVDVHESGAAGDKDAVGAVALSPAEQALLGLLGDALEDGEVLEHGLTLAGLDLEAADHLGVLVGLVGPQVEGLCDVDAGGAFAGRALGGLEAGSQGDGGGSHRCREAKGSESGLDVHHHLDDGV
jgi:hypothetical protein